MALPSIDQRIAEFKLRLETEREFCEELYREQTIRLLAYKFLYYEGKPVVHDESYDASEKSWYVMGRGLEILKEDETSPCVGFDHNHPLAKEAIVMAKSFQEI